MAATGDEGLGIAGRVPIDLAIVDVMLRDHSGIDVLDELKKMKPELVAEWNGQRARGQAHVHTVSVS